MIQPFSINIDSSVLDDLQQRLAKTRWTTDINNEKWEIGTNANYLKDLCGYWQRDFDWRKNEAYLNSFSHFKASIDGMGIHFIHQKGKGKKSVPLLLVHGYPDSFIRFLKLIPLLTEADKDGFSFDLVIPSLPGYGFSDIPTKPGMNPVVMSGLFTKLMTEELGYSRFIAHGGDWGSGIVERIAIDNPQCLYGIHLTDIPWYHLFNIPPDKLSDREKKYLQEGQQWNLSKGGYAILQSTKPQSLAYALNDSPVGLAGWLIEKFQEWSDCNGNFENCYTKDELLTNITIYWATQTINSAIRLYYEAALLMQQGGNKPKEIKKLEVPTAAAMFPYDMVPAPREFAERIYNIRQWTDMKEGGHFAAMEKPQLLADDIRKFVKGLQTDKIPGAMKKTVPI